MIFKKPKGNKNKMKPRGRKRKLAASAILSLRLLFGEPQLASSNSKTFQSGVNSKRILAYCVLTFNLGDFPNKVW